MCVRRIHTSQTNSKQLLCRLNNEIVVAPHTMNPAKEDVPVAQVVVETRWVDTDYIELLDEPYKKVVKQISVHAARYRSLRYKRCLVERRIYSVIVGSELGFEHTIDVELNQDKLEFYCSKAFAYTIFAMNYIYIFFDQVVYEQSVRKIDQEYTILCRQFSEKKSGTSCLIN